MPSAVRFSDTKKLKKPGVVKSIIHNTFSLLRCPSNYEQKQKEPFRADNFRLFLYKTRNPFSSLYHCNYGTDKFNGEV